jgi:hypothetical protein
MGSSSGGLQGASLVAATPEQKASEHCVRTFASYPSKQQMKRKEDADRAAAEAAAAAAGPITPSLADEEEPGPPGIASTTSRAKGRREKKRSGPPVPPVIPAQYAHPELDPTTPPTKKARANPSLIHLECAQCLDVLCYIYMLMYVLLFVHKWMFQF